MCAPHVRRRLARGMWFYMPLSLWKIPVIRCQAAVSCVWIRVARRDIFTAALISRLRLLESQVNLFNDFLDSRPPIRSMVHQVLVDHCSASIAVLGRGRRLGHCAGTAGQLEEVTAPGSPDHCSRDYALPSRSQVRTTYVLRLRTRRLVSRGSILTGGNSSPLSVLCIWVVSYMNWYASAVSRQGWLDLLSSTAQIRGVKLKSSTIALIEWHGDKCAMASGDAWSSGSLETIGIIAGREPNQGKMAYFIFCSGTRHSPTTLCLPIGLDLRSSNGVQWVP